MKPRTQAIKLLEAEGYSFARHGARHDVYFNAQLGRMITLKRHDFDESDLRYISKEIKHNREE